MRLVPPPPAALAGPGQDAGVPLHRPGLLHRPIWLLTGGIALLLLLAFGLLLYSSWRHDRELQPIADHLDDIALLESSDQLMRVLSEEALAGEVDATLVEYVETRLRALRRSGALLDPRSGELAGSVLAGVEAFVASLGAEVPDFPRLRDARLLMRKVLANELDAQKVLLLEKRAVSRREQHIALGLLAGLLVVLLPLALRIRHNIISPLDTLGQLMTLMSHQDYTSAPTTDVDPMLLPLFEDYNRMVNRLVTLEQAHQEREGSLAESVRKATHLLLEQQRRLSQAERLGAVGELAASVAHELRNPLTAIDMALQNLRCDLADPALKARIELVLLEIKRINQQLNALLEGARQTPEPLTRLNVVAVLEEVRTLVRYQTDDRIRLDIHAPEQAACELPESQLRQCLLNLLLNAAQALGRTGGSIDVTATVRASAVRLVVEDDGPGFPDHMLAHGIRSFGSWRAGGTGLGLAMVRRFVTDLGGRIMLENRQTGGARVLIELPQRNADHAADAAGHRR